MQYRIKLTFLFLVLAQGLHSAEEYFYSLWDVLYPALFVSSLVSNNPKTGFLIINLCLFLFGILSWLIVAVKNNHLSRFLIWFWIILELINGVGHPLFALNARGYFPGLVSSLLLLIIDIFLIYQLIFSAWRNK